MSIYTLIRFVTLFAILDIIYTKYVFFKGIFAIEMCDIETLCHMLIMQVMRVRRILYIVAFIKLV